MFEVCSKFAGNPFEREPKEIMAEGATVWILFTSRVIVRTFIRFIDSVKVLRDSYGFGKHGEPLAACQGSFAGLC